MDPGVAEAIAVVEVIHSVTDQTALLGVHNPDHFVAVADRPDITALPLSTSPELG